MRVIQEDLQIALDKLIQRQRVRIVRDGGESEWQLLPSLWEQLAASISFRSGEGASGAATGSRPVIATGVVALCTQIEDWAVRGASELPERNAFTEWRTAEAEGEVLWKRTRTARATMQALLATDTEVMDAETKLSYGMGLRDAQRRFRQAAAIWAKHVDHLESLRRNLVAASLRSIAAAITDQDDLVFWLEAVEGWTAKIRVELGLEPVRTQYIRQTVCPECSAASAIVLREGERIHVPALAVTWEGHADDDSLYHERPTGRVRSIECKACGAEWWRGDPLSALAEQILDANLVEETRQL